MSFLAQKDELFNDARFIPIFNYLINYINYTLIIYDNFVYNKISSFIINLKLAPSELPDIKIGIIYNYFIDELKP